MGLVETIGLIASAITIFAFTTGKAKISDLNEANDATGRQYDDYEESYDDDVDTSVSVHIAPAGKYNSNKGRNLLETIVAKAAFILKSAFYFFIFFMVLLVALAILLAD